MEYFVKTGDGERVIKYTQSYLRMNGRDVADAYLTTISEILGKEGEPQKDVFYYRFPVIPTPDIKNMVFNRTERTTKI
jgi:hypothetical protein